MSWAAWGKSSYHQHFSSHNTSLYLDWILLLNARSKQTDHTVVEYSTKKDIAPWFSKGAIAPTPKWTCTLTMSFIIRYGKYPDLHPEFSRVQELNILHPGANGYTLKDIMWSIVEPKVPQFAPWFAPQKCALICTLNFSGCNMPNHFAPGCKSFKLKTKMWSLVWKVPRFAPWFPPYKCVSSCTRILRVQDL